MSESGRICLPAYARAIARQGTGARFRRFLFDVGWTGGVPRPRSARARADHEACRRGAGTYAADGCLMCISAVATYQKNVRLWHKASFAATHHFVAYWTTTDKGSFGR